MPELAVGDTAPASPGSSGAPPASTGSTVPESSSPAPASTSDPAPTTLGQALRHAAGTPGSDTLPQGPIPFDRHKAILEKERSALSEYKGKYGWAEQVPQDQFTQVAQLVTELNTDPIAFAQRVMLEAANNPKFAQRVRSLAGQALRGRQPQAQTQAQPPTEDVMPQPDADGGYSPDGITKLLAWNTRQTLKEAEKKWGPVLNTVRQITAERQQAQRQQTIEARSQAAFDHIKGLPHASEHLKEIGDAFAKLPAESEADLVSNAYRAYHEIVTPKIAGIAKQQALSELETQARANSTRPTGGRAPQVVPGKPQGLADRLRERAAAGGLR